MVKRFNEKILPLLCCPETRELLMLRGDVLVSPSGKEYPIVDGIPAFAFSGSRVESTVDISVLILALNEEHNIGTVVTEARKELELLGISFEVVVIDGGSTDRTQEVAATAGAKVLPQHLPGYAEALIQGIKTIKGRYLITLDGDLSHPASLIPSLYAKRNDSEIVIGSRWIPQGGFDGPWYRLYLSKILNITFRRALSLPVTDISSGYRLYKTSILTPDAYRSKDFSILEELLVKAYIDGYKISEIPLHFKNRHEGTSHVRLFKFALSYLKTLGRMWLLRNDANGCDYDERAYDSPILPQRYWQRKRFENIMELLGDHRQSGAVLDIGCGSSRIIQAMPHCVAYDLSLKKLRHLEKTNPLRISGSALSLPFPDNSFDCVIHSQLIEHLPPAQEIFSELQRIIKPGGTLIMGTVDYGNWYWPVIERLYDILLPHAYADEHITHYTIDSLDKRLMEFGFKTKAMKTILKGEFTFKATKE